MKFKFHIITIFRLAFICSLPILLCSCHQPLVGFWELSYPPQLDPTDPQWKKHPPKVDEIIPPKADTDVQIIIDQTFEKCRYKESESLKPYDCELTRRDLESLLDKQQAILKQERSLKTNLNNQTDNIAELLIKSQEAIDSDFDTLWQEQSEKIYQEIAKKVLTSKQRKEYYYRLEGAEKQDIYYGRTDNVTKRDVIWSWLFLTAAQKQQITRMYLETLAGIQKPRTVASILRRMNHSDVDRRLMQTKQVLSEIESVTESYNNINNDLSQQDKKARDALREVTWLEANLEAENDPAEKMKLRKQIADKKFEAEKLVAVKDRNNNIFSSYNWKIEDLGAMKDEVNKRLNLLVSLHDGYLDIVSDLVAFDRLRSSKCQPLYQKLREDLANLNTEIEKIKEHKISGGQLL